VAILGLYAQNSATIHGYHTAMVSFKHRLLHE
jgi:hypothetical protein